MLSVTPSGQRADDWIRTSMIRFTRPAPYSVEPRRHKQECKESNPARRFWRPLASQKHTPEFKGTRWELNPYLLLHRQTCLPRTPRTPYSAEREGVEPSRLVKLNRLPTGSRRQSGGPSVFVQQPDQDSNLEHLVRSET